MNSFERKKQNYANAKETAASFPRLKTVGRAYVMQLGSVFGRLTVVAPGGVHISPGGTKKTLWKVVCTCGTEKSVMQTALLRGRISCGCIRRERKKYDVENVYCRLISIYRGSARKRGKEYSLTPEEAMRLFKSDCFYCGAAPHRRIEGQYYSTLYSGIDRVDNDEGYTPKNSVACCHHCNHAKGTMTQAEFKAWAARLCNHMFPR